MPGQGPTSVKVVTGEVGHNDLLITIWILLLIGSAIYFIGVAVGSLDLDIIGTVMVLFTDLANTEVIYDDAKAINKAQGAKVLGATSWSLLAFFFGLLVVPIYSFSYRKNALNR